MPADVSLANGIVIISIQDFVISYGHGQLHVSNHVNQRSVSDQSVSSHGSVRDQSGISHGSIRDQSGISHGSVMGQSGVSQVSVRD